MKVEIWSDVMCPFCYIGKRKFEKALADFEHKDSVQVEWKSFQLNPGMKAETGKNINEYLAEHKGISLERAKQMNDYVTGLAKQVGLTYHFDKAVIANSFDAHRFSHLAKAHGLQDAAEESLFKAYFTEGKDTSNPATLVELGAGIGLDKNELEQMLQSNTYADEVNQDIYEARQVGVTGVPFFVIGGKYAISGAQDSSVFLGALNELWPQFEKDKAASLTKSVDSAACRADGCD